MGTFYTGISPYIAIASNGNVWVTNSGNNTVTELSNTGTFVGTFNAGSYPIEIAIAPNGNVWVTDFNNNTVTELSPTGTTLGTFNVGNGPQGIAIGPNGAT